jgi:arylsulfatase A-like enzyme
MRLIALLFMILVCVPAMAQPKPNVIVFLVDDMGFMDTSLPFLDSAKPRNKQFHTPNMERLAKEGMMFTHAYAMPVCTPSRVSLMTGMNAAHHNVTNWTAADKDTTSDYDSSTTLLRPADWNLNGFSPVPGIPHTIYGTPLPRLMRNAGYFPIHVGKAHFAASGTPGASPYNLGFVVNIAGTMIGSPATYYGEKNYGNIDGEGTYQAVQNMSEYYGTHIYLTDALTSEAIKTLEYPVANHVPFFLYFAQYAVHAPVQGDPEFVSKLRKEGLDKGEANYSSQVENMDKSLGRVMDYLKQNDLEKNTVLIFMSDNGGNSVAKGKGGTSHTQNMPLREGKASVYEGGIREPMIVKWPGIVKPGTKCDAIVTIEDFFPTLLEIAGAKDVKTVQHIDGQSFVPLLKGASHGDPDRVLTWHFPNKWKEEDLKDIDFLSAIRKGDWKLVYRMDAGKLELYNLKTDIGENNDVAAQHPDKVKELAKLMSDKYRQWHTAMPTVKATGKLVPLPDELTK